MSSKRDVYRDFQRLHRAWFDADAGGVFFNALFTDDVSDRMVGERIRLNCEQASALVEQLQQSIDDARLHHDVFIIA